MTRAHAFHVRILESLKSKLSSLETRPSRFENQRPRC